MGLGIGLGVTMRGLRGSGASLPQLWFRAGNGVALDIVIDPTEDGGVILDGNGDVASIPNLGKATAADFLPTGGVNSPVADVGGRSAIQFNGGGTYQPYRGAGDYALGAFDATRRFFYLHAAEQYDLTGDQAGLSVGINGGGSPRVNMLLKTGGVTNTVEHHNGSTARAYSGSPLQRVVGDTTVQAAYHNGADELTMWTNGALNSIRFSSTVISGMATDSAPAMDAITLGAVGNGAFDLKGNLLGAAFDNQADLTLEAAFAKYKAAFDYFGRTSRPAFAIWSLGQSNAQADFPNTATPVNRAAEDGFFRQRIGEYGRPLIRTGLGHSSVTIGTSSPALYFADEWADLTGQVPIFQELAFSGQPITPGLSGKANYWAPQNAEGDAAGDTSLMEEWKGDFEGMRDCLRYSPEFGIQNNIAFILEGEADAAGFNNGENVTVPRLVGFMNAWLDDLRDLYGITTFAIANIGRSGGTESAAAINAPGVQVVRDAWSQVIAARSDAYDVFPHMVPSGPFAIDNLVVDANGYHQWGVGYQADGLHYTTAMYEAVGRTAAYNLRELMAGRPILPLVAVQLAASLSGNSLQVSIGSGKRSGDAAVLNAPSLSTATLDGAAITLDAATPATAVNVNDRADATRSGGGIAINAPDASVFVAGRKWLVVYEITAQDAGVGAPFFDSTGPFSAYAETLPGGVGSHAVVVEVDESYVDTGAQVILRAGPGGSTTFVNLALYSATWTATLPADTEFVSSSNLSLTGATSAVAAQTATALTVGDDYVLTYVLRAQNLTNLFIPQASSAFFLNDLFSSGENTVGIHQIDLTAVKASTGALLRASGDAEFDFISLRRRGEINLQVSLGGITGSISARRPLPGRTFVSSSGSDIAGTGSVSNPLRTTTSAMSVIEAGDTVYMRPGVYQPFAVTVSGTVGNPTILTTLPGEERLAAVRGTLLSHSFYGGPGVLPGMSSEDAVRVFGVSHVTVENLAVGQVARAGVNVKGPGGFTSANTGIIIRGMLSEQTGSAGILVNGDDVNEAVIPIGGTAALNAVRVFENEVTRTNVVTDFNNTTEDEPGGKAECISVSNGVNDVEVFDNHVHDSRQYGIDFKSGVSNGRIYRNTVHGLDRYGIYLDAGERYVRDVDVYDNTVYDCRLGIVLARENDDGTAATDALALEDIRVWNNILYDMERNAILLHNHPKDSDVGVIRNISVRFNTIYNADTADDRQDLAVNWGDRGTNLAGNQVVSNIDIVGNIVWTPSGTIEMILPTLPDARFVIDDNINFANGTFAGTDPLFVNAAGGDYHLQAESPALGIVSGYSASPFNIDANGDARGDPADAGAM